MSSSVYKNNQVSMGVPYQIRMAGIRIQQQQNQVSKNETCEVRSFERNKISENACKEAQSIINSAIEESQKITSEALEEAERLKAEIFEKERKKGFQKGYEEGISRGFKQCDEKFKEAEDIKKQALLLYEQALSEAEKDAVELIINIARKVVNTELAINKETILNMISNAISKCSNREKITVRLSEDDYEYVLENQEQIISENDGIGIMELKKDSLMKKGNCSIDTPYGSVDAGTDTKIRKIEEAFRAAL